MEDNRKPAPKVSTRILAANLKLFYQNRGLWSWYYAVILWGFMLFVQRDAIGILPAFCLVSFFGGAISASLHREILTKPFSFLLPRYKKTPRVVIFIMGTVVNALLGLFFLRFHEPHIFPISIVFATALIFGMVPFLLGAWLSLSIQRPSRWWTFFVALLPIALIFIYYGKAAENFLFNWPPLTIFSGLAICSIAWNWLGDETRARRLCGRPYLGPSHTWDYAKLKKYRKIVLRESKAARAPGRLEIFLLEKIRSLSPSSPNLYTIGNLYEIVGSSLALRQIPLIVVSAILLLCVLFLSSYFIENVVNAFYLFPIISVAVLDLFPAHAILLPLGREEKYYSFAGSGIIIGAFLTLLATVVAILSNMLAPVMPEITFRQALYSYHALDVRQLFLCPLLIPVMFVIALQFPKARYLIAIFSIVFGIELYSGGLIRPPSPSILVLIALTWVGFIMYVKYYFRRRSLVFSSR